MSPTFLQNTSGGSLLKSRVMTVDFFFGKRFKESTEKYFCDTRIMVSKGMVSKRKYWIS